MFPTLTNLDKLKRKVYKTKKKENIRRKRKKTRELLFQCYNTETLHKSRKLKITHCIFFFYFILNYILD